MIKIAIDAMGGDNAPGKIVQGAIDSLALRDNIQIVLVGDEKAVKAELAKYTYDTSRVSVVHSTQIIETGEPPVAAIREKKDSSLVVAQKLVRDGEADAFISSGSTGAILVGGQLIVGRIKGIRRTPLAPLIPTTKGASLLIDCGANVDARPEDLVQFARMGSIYMERVCKKKKPTVGIVNIGAEGEKGNALVKETFPLLKACENINFIGNVESRDIPYGAADVIVTEAFVGNVILKLYEGVGSALIGEIKKGMLSNLKGKLGALLVKKNLKGVVKRFDASEYGGAPMLGLKALVVKTHGSATEKEIKNAVLQCVDFVEAKTIDQINGIVS